MSEKNKVEAEIKVTDTSSILYAFAALIISGGLFMGYRLYQESHDLLIPTTFVASSVFAGVLLIAIGKGLSYLYQIVINTSKNI